VICWEKWTKAAFSRWKSQSWRWRNEQTRQQIKSQFLVSLSVEAVCMSTVFLLFIRMLNRMTMGGPNRPDRFFYLFMIRIGFFIHLFRTSITIEKRIRLIALNNPRLLRLHAIICVSPISEVNPLLYRSFHILFFRPFCALVRKTELKGYSQFVPLFKCGTAITETDHSNGTLFR
jgi:Ni/Fe-hydrogenase subunit HybB-like protein